MIGSRWFDIRERSVEVAGSGVTLVERTSVFRIGAGRVGFHYQYRRPVAVEVGGGEPGRIPIHDVHLWARVAVLVVLATVYLTGGDR